MYSPNFGGNRMTVRFASLGDIREFVGLATLQPYNVMVFDGNRTVNAKMFTIDFAHPLRVDVGENESVFAPVAKKFICES